MDIHLLFGELQSPPELVHSTSQPKFLSLPPEVVSKICTHLKPSETYRLGQTCRQIYGFIPPPAKIMVQEIIHQVKVSSKDRGVKMSHMAKSIAHRLGNTKDMTVFNEFFDNSSWRKIEAADPYQGYHNRLPRPKSFLLARCEIARRVMDMLLIGWCQNIGPTLDQPWKFCVNSRKRTRKRPLPPLPYKDIRAKIEILVTAVYQQPLFEPIFKPNEWRFTSYHAILWDMLIANNDIPLAELCLSRGLLEVWRCRSKPSWLFGWQDPHEFTPIQYDLSTPIFYAIDMLNVKMARWLVSKGADCAAIRLAGLFPMTFYVIPGVLSELGAIREPDKTFGINLSALTVLDKEYPARQERSQSIAKMLTFFVQEVGIDIDYRALSENTPENRTLLYNLIYHFGPPEANTSAFKDYYEVQDIIAVLMDLGANTQFEETNALHFTMDLRPYFRSWSPEFPVSRSKIFETLLQKGADPNAPESYLNGKPTSFPPLLKLVYYDMRHSRPESYKVFNPNSMYWALGDGEKEFVLTCIRLLVQYGADVNCAVKHDKTAAVLTPLTVAAAYSGKEYLKELLPGQDDLVQAWLHGKDDESPWKDYNPTITRAELVEALEDLSFPARLPGFADYSHADGCSYSLELQWRRYVEDGHYPPSFQVESDI